MKDDDENHDAEVTLDDCMQEFKRASMLDENNLWYCNKCKDHVQATKTLEIYKAPNLLCISFKRFKTGKQRASMYGMGSMFGDGGSQKLSTHVDFPIEGLDMSKYVLRQPQDGEDLIYDLYAVSNHYGSLGFGHYTAYARHYETGKWHYYDDSSVSEVSDTKRIVSDAAYNLFYRRRGYIDLTNINYSELRQVSRLDPKFNK